MDPGESASDVQLFEAPSALGSGRRPSLELPPRRGAWAENEKRPIEEATAATAKLATDADARHQDANDLDQVPELFKERRAAMEDEAKKAEAYEEARRAEEEQLGAKAVQVIKAMKMDMQNLDKRRQVLHGWISWSGFDSAVGVVIIANAVTIGLETHYASWGCSDPSRPCQASRIPAWLAIVDTVFFGVYLVEFFLRFYVYGWAVFKSNWIKFDVFLIVSSSLDLILKPIQFDSELLDQVMVVRMLRLARLARALRLMVQFQTLWQLVQGLMNSLTTLLWTFLLIMILMYMFAILGMEVITIDNAPGADAYNAVAAANFRSFQDAILTLLQVFSLDSIGSIYRPLVNHRMFLFFYFIMAILVLAIALLNLVTAVMVNTSLDQASQDKEAKKAWEAAKRKKEVEQLKRLFAEFDEDGSGELTLDELESAPEELLGDLKEISGIDDVEELFNLLDYDGGGAIDTNEFCEGILKVAGDSRNSVEMGRLMKQCNEILHNTNALVESVKAPGDDGLKGRGHRGSRFVCDDRQGPGLVERVVKLESEVSDLHGDLWWAVNKLQSRENERIGRNRL